MESASNGHQAEQGRRCLTARRPHIIKHNKGSEFPSEIILFDTETWQTGWPNYFVYHMLNFGYAAYIRRHRDDQWTPPQWHRFTTRTEWWDFVGSKTAPRHKLYLLCHNTSFDLPVLDVFNELPMRGYKLCSAIIDAPPTILTFRTATECKLTGNKTCKHKDCQDRRRDVRTIVILDSLNFWRMKLEKLGEEIGLNKLDMPDNDLTSIEWQSYGRRDVEILVKAIKDWFTFLRAHDFGSFANTLAGQSMKAFRHKFMKHDIYIDDHEPSLKLTREGYYGGRCEAFRIGEFQGKFTLLDVNSMYPSVMAVQEYPCKRIGYYTHADTDDLRRWLEKYSITARVVLCSRKPFSPVRLRDKLVFPVGEYESILSTPEIEFALRTCEITRVIEVALYEKAPLFQEMMNELYTMRLLAKSTKDTVQAFLVRMLMNSFYGKWGQSGYHWLEKESISDLSCKRWIEINADTDEVTHWRQLGGLVQSMNDSAETRDSLPVIAAHVTAFARMKLFGIIEQAGWNHVLYCDTDSVLTDREGHDNLKDQIDPTGLGQLSIKGEYSSVQIWGAKDYRFGKVRRTKGVRKSGVWVSDNVVEQEKWSGLRGLVATGLVDRPTTRRITKSLKRCYDKGIVGVDGLVTPWVLPLASVQG